MMLPPTVAKSTTTYNNNHAVKVPGRKPYLGTAVEWGGVEFSWQVFPCNIQTCFKRIDFWCIHNFRLKFIPDLDDNEFV